MIVCSSCATTKTFYLDSSLSQGNLVKREWKVNWLQYDSSMVTSIKTKKTLSVQLIVTDNLGRKDTAIKVIR
jgi:hypothetical protein